ncbi:hypothetical protein ACIBBE_24365 [Streptomyces sp. NPDC051644]|uniref:hypothetical protein n=1 Tax=Streptomyces sp. NPDC051644 TaxID=3365666 RepID=UPI003798A109
MRAMTMEPPMPPSYEQNVTVGRLRGEWGELLALSCNDALTASKHQLVSRNDKPVAVIVSTGWYGQARRAIGAPDAEVFSSDKARSELARLLTDVATHARHIVIKVDRYEVVALVPVAWHQRAVEILTAQDAAST